jgi:hypothetical protein
MSNVELDRLRLLLERLATADDMNPMPRVEQVAFDVQDCRLQVIQEQGSKLSEEQIRTLQQLDFRLDGVREGSLSWGAVPALASRTLAAFGWSGSKS